MPILKSGKNIIRVKDVGNSYERKQPQEQTEAMSSAIIRRRRNCTIFKRASVWKGLGRETMNILHRTRHNP
jgi:hypothetical protein